MTCEIEEPAIDGAAIGSATRENDGHTRADGPRADFQWPIAFDQRLLTNLHAGHVGDRIEKTRLAFEGDSEIASPPISLRR